MKRKFLLCATIILMVALVFGGCESDAQTGGLIGAGVGGLAGQAIGHDTKSTLIGTAVGGGAGYVIGAEKDKKKQQAKTQAALQDANTFYVNITNSNGSITAVKIVKSGNVYIGEKKEQYLQFPTEEQLKAAGYGF